MFAHIIPTKHKLIIKKKLHRFSGVLHGFSSYWLKENGHLQFKVNKRLVSKENVVTHQQGIENKTLID